MLSVVLSELMEAWPPAVRLEIGQMNLTDAAVALPLVVAVAMCEASGGTCEAQLQALAAAGKQDAAACANVMLHDATVKVAVITGTAK